MVASAAQYAGLFDAAMDGNVDWPTDAINCALLLDTYTPDLLNDAVWGDVSAHETVGAGYGAGGVALAAKTHTVTGASAWGIIWAGSTTYSVGQIVRPVVANGYVYRCAVGGASDVGEPAWPTTVGLDVVDGAATWTCIGRSVSVFSSGDASWGPAATIDAAFAVVYDTASNVLIAMQDFGGTLSSVASTYVVKPDAALGWCAFTAA